MKNNIIYLACLAFFFSCGASHDKKSELNELKSSREKLDAQIAKLQAEVDPKGTAAEKPVTVKVDTMKGCTFNHYVEVQGVVDADQNVAVSPQTAGIVTNVYVREGSNVRKGQVLAELDAQVLKQSLEEVKTQLDLANNLYEKQKALWDKKSEAKYNSFRQEPIRNHLKEELKHFRNRLVFHELHLLSTARLRVFR